MIEHRSGYAQDAALDEELKRLIDYFEDYELETMESRKLSERDRDYYDGHQWTDEEVEALRRRKQPIIVSNRIKPKVDFLLGMELQQRSDPKAFPRTPMHDDDADAVTDSLRYVADNTDLDQTSVEALANYLIEGTEAVEIRARPRGNDFEIDVLHIDWDRVFYDPHGRRRDYSDVKYKGVSVWMDLEDAIDQWPHARDVLESAFAGSTPSMDDTFEDVPRTIWSVKDSGRKRIRINQIYYRKAGIWNVALYCNSGFVRSPQVSPYIDENGDPQCPIELQSAYIDRDGQRYGAVRQYISPQDEINKRRSKALHLMSVRQTFGSKGSVPDVAEAKRELAKPDGHLDVTHGEFGKEFGILPTGDLAQAQFSLLQEAKDEIDATGVNAALSGKEERNMSGRALLARQQGGAVEVGRLFDGHRAFKRRIYRQIWNRIRQYWTAERWIRVTDNEQNMKWVGLNQPILAGEQIMAQYGQIPAEYQNDPRLQRVVGVRNKLADLDVDIILEDVPDTVTIQAEQFEVLAGLAKAYPGSVPFESLVELSQLRNKRGFLESLQNAQSPQAQAIARQQQMDEAESAAEVERKQAQAARDVAEATKTQAETMRLIQGGA